jgi:EmrB/QacA subfamily drug resistance transporter
VVIASAHLMATLDTTVLFVALPSVQRGLSMSVTDRQWVITAYTVAMAGLLLPGGRLADRLGARRTLLIGVAGFACASAVGGASVNATMLISARAVQGAFAAILISSTKSLLVTVYSDENQRARVIGIFTATLASGGAVGLLLGGLLTSGLSWRWCLYINVILAMVPLIAGHWALPAIPGRKDVRISLASVLLAVVGMGTLVYGLGEASSLGWSSGWIIASLIAAVAALGGFVALQVGKPQPLLPLRVVLDRNRGWAMIILVINAISSIGLMLILTYQLQDVMSYSALRTGLALIPFVLTSAVAAAFIAPRLMLRVPLRWLLAGSIVAEAAGLVPLFWLAPNSHYVPLILAATVIEGLASGVATAVTLTAALANVLPSDTGAAGAVTSAATQFGSSVGAALINTIAVTATASYLADHVGASLVSGTVHGFVVALIWATAITLIAAVPIALFVNARTPARRD